MKIINDHDLLNLFKQMTLNGYNPKNRIISFAQGEDLSTPSEKA